jgi:hypothetical protein
MTTSNVSLAVVVDGLRRWARGACAEEAAVELLVRAFHGRYASPGYRWVRACDRPGWFWLDGEPLLHDTAALSGGEQRVLSIVGALVSGLALSDLASILAGLDRANLQLVLAAFAHAAGSHEHSDFDLHGGRLFYRRLGPVVDWPADRVRAAS